MEGFCPLFLYVRRTDLKKLWAAESRAMADISLVRFNLDLYDMTFDEYRIPIRWAAPF